MMLKLALACALLVFLLAAPSCSSQKVKLLLTGRIGLPEYPVPRWFMSEPLVDLLQVPSRIYFRFHPGMR